MTLTEIPSIYGVDINNLPQGTIFCLNPLEGSVIPQLEINTSLDYRSNIYIHKEGSICWMYDGINNTTRTYKYLYNPSPLIGTIQECVLHYFNVWGDLGVAGSLDFMFEDKKASVHLYMSSQSTQVSVVESKKKPYMLQLDSVFEKWGNRQVVQRQMKDYSDTRLSFVGD